MVLETITSPQNTKIKYLKKLNFQTEKKEAYFLIENLKTILDAFQAGFLPKNLFLTNNLLKKQEKELSNLLNKTNYYLITDQSNKAFSTLSTPSGIAAIYKKEEAKLNLSQKILYLNNINDPGNLGTILRTALAFDFKNIILDETCANLYNPKTLSAAKNAIFKLNIVEDNNLKILKNIKNNKIKIYATEVKQGKNPKIIQEKNFCLVLGSESHGVSQKILALADDFIKIKISDQIESLNVAIAAGIIMAVNFNN